jgi:hypothetical protein
VLGHQSFAFEARAGRPSGDDHVPEGIAHRQQAPVGPAIRVDARDPVFLNLGRCRSSGGEDEEA